MPLRIDLRRVRPDPNYDPDGAYSLGRNQSPNGAIEYKGSAFGTNLKGAVLFAQFSTGDNVRAIRVDASGKIIGDDVLRRPDGRSCRLIRNTTCVDTKSLLL